MLGDGAASQVMASHQYLTEGLKEIFPEYAELANKSDLLLVGFQIRGISN
jgi:hypothetical protein